MHLLDDDDDGFVYSIPWCQVYQSDLSGIPILTLTDGFALDNNDEQVHCSIVCLSI